MLTEFQIKKLTKLFNTFDGNRNGFRELEDARLMINNLAHIRGWEKGSAEYKKIEDAYMNLHFKILELADTNQDGKITLEEHLAFYDHILATGEYRIHLNGFVTFVMDIFDADGDGLISPTEYKHFFHVYNLPEDEAEEAFAHLDLNGDGQISNEEWRQALEEFYFNEDPNAPGNWFLGRLE